MEAGIMLMLGGGAGGAACDREFLTKLEMIESTM